MKVTRKDPTSRKRGSLGRTLMLLVAVGGLGLVASPHAYADDRLGKSNSLEQPSESSQPDVKATVDSPPASEAQVNDAPRSDVNPVVNEPLPLQNEFKAMGLAAPALGVRGSLGASVGVTAESYSSAPAMLGDFFGGSFLQLDNAANRSDTISLNGGDRRFKVAENVSPIPRDRLFFNFNHFENALQDHQGRAISLDRYTPGLEKTFFDKMTSIEVRLPLVQGLDSTQDLSSTDTRGFELGNLAIAGKVVLLSGSNWLISGGSSLTLPTGDDFVLQDALGQILRVENQSVHMAPFIGWLVMPTREWFLQGFFQTDFDLNGNDVRDDRNDFVGTVQDQNLLFVDASVGKWLFLSASRNQRLTGIAGMLELHYTSTINDTDSVNGIGNAFQHVDVLNLSSAVHCQFGSRTFRLGGTVPLREDEEKLFDAEIIAQLSQAF